MGGGAGVACDRLPIELSVCPTCHHGIKQARGWTWLEINAFVGGVHPDCKDDFPCPLCMATSEMGKCGLIWIGERFYKTPAEFVIEAQELGISRRLSTIPKGFKLGETWVLLAHPKTIPQIGTCDECKGTGEVQVAADDPMRGVRCPHCDNGVKRTYVPGIFRIFRPHAIEKVLPESMRGSEEVAELEKRGITPVFVPDNDKDHQGSVYDDPEEEEAA